MTTSCPPEGDPRLRVSGFISDPSERTLSGLRNEGQYVLMDVVRDELVKNYPKANYIRIDNDVVADNGIDLGRELEAYLESKMVPGMNIILFYDQPTVIKWQEFVEKVMTSGKHDVRAFFAGTACRQVPICCKLL
jgi:hypothetical protein